MILPDHAIVSRCNLPSDDPSRLRISPFVRESPQGVISYGLTSAGYDMTLGDEFKVFTNVHNGVVSPKRLDKNCFVDYRGKVCVIPPNSFALGVSVELFRIPRDVLGVCLGKSTYARCGIIACCTPLEPEWEGHVTVEISNTTPCPVEVFAFEGIMQVLFVKLESACDRSYTDKKGRYQNQVGITLPFVRS